MIADAGGTSAATIDDFVAHRLRSAATRVKLFMALELGGITEPHITHNSRTPMSRKQTASLDTFLAAIERHVSRVAGLKLWATASAGLRWVDHGVALSEIAGIPLLVHVGDVAPESVRPSISGETLDRLRGGDIVTHCFTGLKGALIGHDGSVLNEVPVARSRGVAFDAAPGKVNLSFRRAIQAMEQGWLPDTLSTDLHRWSQDYPVRSLANVMSTFMALGLSLSQVVERASTNPAALIDATVGSPLLGQPATISLLSRRQTSVIFGDGSGGTITGSEVLEPFGCFVDGRWFDADLSCTPKSAEATSPASAVTAQPFLREVESELRYLASKRRSWRGDQLHLAVHRARTQCDIPIAEGIDMLFDLVLEERPVMPAGWALEELGAEHTMQRLAQVLAS